MANMAIWADKPLTLLTTPQSKQQNPLVPENQFVAAASVMCLVHNFFLRGYNSIVLQAAHVKPKDVPDFIQYCKCWWNVLHLHHHGEETSFFPAVEKAAGEACMQDNVAQHQLFHDGLEKALEYLNSCEKDPSSFSGDGLTRLFESFGTILHEHLAAEIPTLLAIERFGEKVPLEKLLEEEAVDVMSKCGMVTGLTSASVMIDVTFENGLWKSWPPAPALIKWGLRNVFPYRHQGWWRFAPCDWNGIPKALYAVSS